MKPAVTLSVDDFRQCVWYTIAQAEPLHSAVQMKSDSLIRRQKTFDKVAAYLVFVLHFGRLQ